MFPWNDRFVPIEAVRSAWPGSPNRSAHSASRSGGLGGRPELDPFGRQAV